jgi:HPt (histidine-containing phosphotransfer) domain-containing protein
MIELSIARVDSVASPPLAPGAAPIDLDHLSQMTLGDRALEAEVLALFDRQARMLIGRMCADAPALVAASAHTLTGSARGIGAWRVAEAAAVLERAASREPAGLQPLIGALQSSVAEVHAAIAEILRAH